MPKIIFIGFDDAEHVVHGESGASVMDCATRNSVPGIDGDCGGQAACGTCHVYVDDAWLAKTGPAHDGIEKDMLSLTDGAVSNSRLSCQITLTDELDGLILRMPKSQH
jgi:ferredoxin, 2Fe-2S